MNALAEALRRSAVGAWIEAQTSPDAALGRGDHNWAAPPAAALRPHLPALLAGGVRAFVGGGQMILVDFKPANPVAIQRRALAQRELVLDLQEK